MNGINVDNNEINVNNNPINVDNNTQREREIETEREIESKVNIKTKLNKNKLNNLFIYMVNGEKNDENILEVDRMAIINCLKTLEIYMTDLKLPYMTTERLTDIKLQYWAIKEIYFSPYKIYLDKLTKNKFVFKYLQSKQYMKINIEDEDILTEFMSYFIKILQIEFKEKENT